MSFNNINNLDDILVESNNNFTILIDYVLYNNSIDFEKEYLTKIEEFEKVFNNNFKQLKLEYYKEHNIYDSSRYRVAISDWMLERIIQLDLEDSMDKFLSSGIIDYLKKK